MSFSFKDNWRNQLDATYSTSLEYNSILTSISPKIKSNEKNPENTTSLGKAITSPNTAAIRSLNSVGLSNQIDAIRFPPHIPLPILPPLTPSDYEIPPLELSKNDKNHLSINSKDSLAGLEFLEAMFLTILEKSINIRQSIIEHHQYIVSHGQKKENQVLFNNKKSEIEINNNSYNNKYNLKNSISNNKNNNYNNVSIRLYPITDVEEINYFKSVILDNLISLKDESLLLMKEMIIFNNEQINDILHENHQTGKVIINERKQIIITVSKLLKAEIVESLLHIDSLSHIASSLINYPTQPYCPIDGITIDWVEHDQLVDKYESILSNRTKNYIFYMRFHQQPVCGHVVSYLQATLQNNKTKSNQNNNNLTTKDYKGYNSIFKIENYKFDNLELKYLFSFLILQHKNSIQSSLLGSTSTNNSLNKLTLNISVIKGIRQLILSNCSFTDENCSILANYLPEFDSLQTLILSYNLITTSGISSLAASLFNYVNITTKLVGFPLCYLNLDHNNIDEDGASLLSELLVKLPYLESLSLSHNPIKDIGLYYLLKVILNKHRKVYDTLLSPDSFNYDDYNISSNNDNNEKKFFEFNDDDNDILFDSELLPNITSNGVKRRKSFIHSYNPHSYFYNYFTVKHFVHLKILETNRLLIKKEKDDWLNQSDDEFEMDAKSDYSIENDENSRVDHLNQLDAPLKQVHDITESYIITSQSRKKYLKLIQLILRVRLKLIAYNAFLRLYRRSGHILSTVNIANCDLTSQSMPIIQQVLLDNAHISCVDLSENPKLFSNFTNFDNSISYSAVTSYKYLHDLLSKTTSLTTIKLNSCGINDYGIMMICKGILHSSQCSIENLEVSHNIISATGMTWLNSLCSKQYFIDSFKISTTGYHRQAPFFKRGIININDMGDDIIKEKREDQIMDENSNDFIYDENDGVYVDDDNDDYDDDGIVDEDNENEYSNDVNNADYIYEEVEDGAQLENDQNLL
eukprot:gene11580-15508_t